VLEAAGGGASRFEGRDEGGLAWEIIRRVREEWAARGREGLAAYRAGTWGRLEAADLPGRDGRRWRRL